MTDPTNNMTKYIVSSSKLLFSFALPSAMEFSNFDTKIGAIADVKIANAICNTIILIDITGAIFHKLNKKPTTRFGELDLVI